MSQHKSTNQHTCSHSHSHSRGIFGKNTELYFALISGAWLLIGFTLESLNVISSTAGIGFYILAYFFGGYYALIEAKDKIKNGEFEVDFLMIIAALGAAYLESWEEGALLLFLFSTGHALEHYAMDKAKNTIKSLGHLSPKKAFLKTNGGVKEVDISILKINDTIIVRPNTKIAADGVIISGRGSVDESSITGESMPAEKTEILNLTDIKDFEHINREHIVFTGSVNGDHTLEVKVLRLSEDSTIARLIKMVSEVETKKSPTQRLTKKFEKWFVPFVLILVLSLCFAHLVIDETFHESLYRAISVLVASSPCALAISTPSAVLSAVARAAKGGVLIKGGKALEDLGGIKAIAFDKTGTLTEGKPKVTDLVVLQTDHKTEVLSLIYAVEKLSNHPLAKAVTKHIRSLPDIPNRDVEDITVLQGMGIKAQYKGNEILIGNPKLMKDKQIRLSDDVNAYISTFLKEGKTLVLVAYKGEMVSVLSIMDTPRETAKNTLKQLKRIGIEQMIMLTGDHQTVGKAIGNKIGLTDVKGGLLPEDKVSAIKTLESNFNRIAMVGDGVNDAPALAISTVGIAMGAAGSEVALEAADVALMSDKIETLPFVIGLSRYSKRIIKQNLWISLGIVALLIPATIFGFANIGWAVLIHEGSTLIVVLNALRLLRYTYN